VLKAQAPSAFDRQNTRHLMSFILRITRRSFRTMLSPSPF